MTHEIRLAGPWDYSDGIEDQWHRCVLPFANDPKTNDPSATTIRRKFHKPSRLEAGTRLLLVVESEPKLDRIQINRSEADVVNSAAVDSIDGNLSLAEFDISETIEDFNVVSIPLKTPGTRIDAVRLRIVEPE